jgi:hypothetical protein
MAAESDEMGNSSDVGAGGDETGKGGSRGDIRAAITGGTNMGAFVWSEKKLKLVDISLPTPESNSSEDIESSPAERVVYSLRKEKSKLSKLISPKS